MTIREVEQWLRSAKNAPELGGGVSVSAADDVWARVAARMGTSPVAAPAKYGMRDYLAYAKWRLSRAWLQPASVLASSLALVFGGWVATVNASFDSVPGDVLYPVKLATERAQITLATSGEQRAKLHAEFAGRRVDELSVVATSGAGVEDERVRAAASGFRQEMDSVNLELATIASANPEEAAALAIIVDQKTDAYAAAIAQAAPAVTGENQTRVEEALGAAEDANEQAISAIVQSHEASRQPETEESLQKNFQEKLRELETRVALSLGRLQVVENALVVRQSLDASYEKRISDARERATENDAAVARSMDTFAAGGYRAAFDALAAAEESIVASELAVAELEIEITAGAAW